MAQSQSAASTDAGTEQPQSVSFAFLKGGSTKTTLSINTARHLAERNGEGSVLFIDFDPNGHATRNYDFGHDGLYEQRSDLDRVLLGSSPDMDPRELVYETPFKFDFLPSTDQHESIEKRLSTAAGGSGRLRTRIVEELLGDEYDYIIIDQPSDAGTMNNNGILASQNVMMPMLPKGETIGSFERTRDRLIAPLEEQNISINIMAVVPNLLGDRIDQQTNDRELLENLNKSFKSLVPEFAQISEDEWEQIDNGEMAPPKPGIRETAEITNGMKNESLPLLDYAPDNPQNEHFDELASIIENGGIDR
jgi:chromosome partitioning protein